MGTFDVSKLPRRELLEEAFPGQPIPEAGWGKVRCTLPSCAHKNEDKNPALSINVEAGTFECFVSGRKGSGWKQFVTEWWGEERWREVSKMALPPMKKRGKLTLDQRWAGLTPERTWTEGLRLDPALSGRYLRSGVRYPGDPRSESVIAIRREGQIVGIKWRLPTGAAWKVGGPGKNDPHAKYTYTQGSDQSPVFLAELVDAHRSATVVVCAGEKDALALASHLDRSRWVPVSGSGGEGKVPWELAELLKGRRVVVAYDGDEAGRNGAYKVWDFLRAHAFSVQVATLPIDRPPGASKPGWDVAEVLSRRGPVALVELLEAAGPAPEDWRPKNYSPPSGPPSDARPKGPRTSYELKGWSEHDGEVVKWRRSGKGEDAEEIPHCLFRGLPRVTRVRRVWKEDPEEPTGWREEEAVTYAFKLRDGKMIERIAGAGAREFGQLLDSTAIARATEAIRKDDRARLYLWTLQASEDAETIEERCAVGPHGELGWLSPQGVRVRRGRVERTPFRVGVPLEAEEFRRYRLDVARDRDFSAAGRWIVEHLLRCDHTDGAYTLPMLGGFLAAPLWEYVDQLRSWQRYAFFIQGPSGVGKSQLSRYFWSFWGSFLESQGLTTFRSSATYLEGLLHHARGVPMFVGDFKRANMNPETYRDAMGLIQAYADRSSRGRARRGSSELDRKTPPRCSLVIDGEDVPEGEQSTLGRLVVLEVVGSGPMNRCATAEDSTLDPAMVALLPGVTARWIGWTQLNHEAIGRELDLTVSELEAAIPRGSTNRSRLIRNYAVQILSARTFLDFLQGCLGAQDLEGAFAELRAKAWDVHLELALSQLCSVAAESAGEQFLTGLCALLNSQTVHLRPEDDGGERTPFSGPHPFGDAPHNSTCVGTYHHGVAHVWPDVVIPLVNRHTTQGGGTRINFTKRAIAQQLEGLGVLTGEQRRRVKLAGGSSRIKTWEMPLSEIGGKEQRQPFARDDDEAA